MATKSSNTDYRLFKTPFYELTITDPTGKKSVKMPMDFLRLVEKIEIFDCMLADDQSVVTLTIVEGSREPASTSPTKGSKGLYPLNQGIAGYLTNRTGLITDLRFSGDHGITFISSNEQETGQLDLFTYNSTGQVVSRQFIGETTPPKFLFEADNKIILKFGYLEDKNSIRTIQRSMKIFKIDFPESGQVVTTITCLDSKSDYDRYVAKQGIPFATFTTTGTGNNLVTFQDLTTTQVVQNVCDTLGIACLVSTNFPSATLDKDHVKSIMGGESLHQFFARMADLNHAIYSIIPDPKTGIDTVVFMSKTDFEKQPIFQNENMLTYKAPGSIIKSVSINGNFNQITGNSQSGVDSQGNLISANNDYGVEQVTMFQGEKLGGVPSDKAINSAELILGTGNYAGKSEITPTVDQPTLPDDISKKNAENDGRIIQLEMTTLGYPKLIPGVIEINGLGVRYSGNYRILSARHLIDANGYTTVVNASTMSVATGGVIPQGATQGQEKEDKTVVQMFKPAVSSTSGFSTTTQQSNSSDLSNSYQKLQGLQN